MNTGYDNYYNLTIRELQILVLLCNKITNSKKIGKILFISQNTVKAHLRTLYSKLGVNDKAQAVAEAFEDKIIDKTIPHFISTNEAQSRLDIEKIILELD